MPVTLDHDDIQAASVAIREENAAFLTAIFEGNYSQRYLRDLGDDAPRFTPAEMRTISSPLDAIGLNIYTPTYVRHAPGGYQALAMPENFPRMASDWLKVGPECMYWGPRLVQETWKPRAIFVTENGCSAVDQMTAQGEVLDTDRIMYLSNCLSQLQRAVNDGVGVKGYFVWSLLDNYEWADGYGKRFGLVYVDYKTQKRTPKLSAQFYSSVIASGGTTL